MARVFICYRREDSGGYAGRIYDRLTARLGEKNVFIDIDTIMPGDDFVDFINEKVGQCETLLAVIGPRWTIVSDKNGTPRLHDPRDFVRLEIIPA